MWMSRLSLINSIISTMDDPSYLEIGFGLGEVFESVTCKDKICCDPTPWDDVVAKFDANPNCVLLSSDDFFAQNKKKFDFIFIDGHHEYDYVRRDFFNAMNALNEGGYVMLHDCNPPNEWRCRPISQFINGEAWNGDGGYRLLMELYATCTEYNWVTSYEDEGCCVVWKGERTPISLPAQDWKTFDANRKEILNLMSIDEIISVISEPS